MHRPTLRQRRVLRAAAVPAAMVASAALVWQSSYAAFTATTSSDANSWTTGSVSLTNDMTGTAVFNAGNIKPGDVGQRCITVTNTGSLGGDVKLYAAQTGSAALRTALQVTVERGSGGDATCAGFTASDTVFATGALNGFPGNYGAAGATWTAGPAGPSGTTVYRIAWALPGSADNSVAGATAGATFTWDLRTV